MRFVIIAAQLSDLSVILMFLLLYNDLRPSVTIQEICILQPKSAIIRPFFRHFSLWKLLTTPGMSNHSYIVNQEGFYHLS